MSCCIYLAMQANDSLRIFDDRKLLCFSLFFTFLPEASISTLQHTLNGRCFKAVWIQRLRKPSLSLKAHRRPEKISCDKNTSAHIWKLCDAAANSIIQIAGRNPAQTIFFGMDYILHLLSWYFFFFFFFFYFILIKSCPSVTPHANRSSHHPYHCSINSCGLFPSQRCAEAMQGSHLAAAGLWVASMWPAHGWWDTCCLLPPLPHFFLTCLGKGGAWAPFPAPRAVYNE